MKYPIDHFLKNSRIQALKSILQKSEKEERWIKQEDLQTICHELVRLSSELRISSHTLTVTEEDDANQGDQIAHNPVR